MIWKREKPVYAILCLIAAGFWCASYVLGLSLIESFYSPLLKLEDISEDNRVRHGRQATADPSLVLLGVDKQKYEEEIWPDEMEQSEALRIMASVKFPWPRVVWAEIAERLLHHGARVIVFDFIFPDEVEGDAAFRQVIEDNPGRIILGANLERRAVYNDGGGGWDYKIILPSASLVPEGMTSRDISGLVNFVLDADGTVRRLKFNYRMPATDEGYPTLLARVMQTGGKAVEGIDSTKMHRFRFTGPPQSVIKFRPVYEVLTPALWEANYDSGRFFKDKIVFVGPAANWTQDMHKTPYQLPMFGPELHLNAINAVLTGETIEESSVLANLGLIAGAGGLAWLLICVVRAPLARAAVILLAAIAYTVLCQELYDRGGVMILMVTPLLSFTTAGGACMIHQFVMASLERARTRSMMEKYVSSNVVKEMLDSGNFELSLGGRRRPCTILFSDIRGFTTMTEVADSQQLVSQLNEYLSEMVECVFRHNGTLDKFIGDAVMAVWGNAASRGPQQDAIDGVASAMEMLRALDRLNEDWARRGIPPLAIGIGLNHGEVIAGNMGSSRRQDFTVIGDAVNLASRLEGTTKNYQLPIIIGENVAELVRDAFLLQHVDLIQVKGKTRPVRCFTVLEAEGGDVRAGIVSGLADYHAGIEHFLARRFDEASQCFKAAAKKLPNVTLVELYLERCKVLREDPPPPDWDGVVVMKTK